MIHGHMKRLDLTTSLSFTLIVWWGAAAAAPCTLDRASGTTIDRQPFLEHAYGARWSAAADRIAFMQPGEGGYYRIFTVRPDGTARLALSGPPELPAKHRGTPYWHPSGAYLLLTAQKADWHGRSLFGVPDYEALPGFGRHDDLWLMSADGSQAFKLTDDANTPDQGVLVPVFSPDGKRIAWSARQPGGHYALQVATLSLEPRPHLENLHAYQPGGAVYYETGSFTSDGGSLLYTSDQDTHSFWQSQIYRLELASGASTRLTSGRDYNEHPTVVSTPSGDWVVYMSTRGVDRFPLHLMLGTDWYATRSDGGATKRLTTMNVNRKSNPENAGTLQVAGTVAVSPKGDFMLGDVQDHLLRQTGLIKVVRFTCASAASPDR
jgi:Tol biopolymer transport system component